MEWTIMKLWRNETRKTDLAEYSMEVSGQKGGGGCFANYNEYACIVHTHTIQHDPPFFRKLN
jgi:hypothetical protein